MTFMYKRHGFARFIDLFFPEPCTLCEFPIVRGRIDSSPICAACRVGLPTPLDPRCIVCGCELISENEICTRCRERSFSFAANSAVFAYSGAVRELIHRYKFEGQWKLAEFFATTLAAGYHREGRTEPIVPIPPRPRKRGTPRKHVSRIAKILNRNFGIDVVDLLERKPGVPQKALDYEGRLSNLQGKFVVANSRQPPSIKNRKFLLLDDVMTTGATLDECARVLLAAGASRVEAYTLALD